MIIKETLWYSGQYGFCGIVLVEDALTGERRVIIGVHSGQGETADRHMIVAGGSIISRDQAGAILKHLKGTGG